MRKSALGKTGLNKEVSETVVSDLPHNPVDNEAEDCLESGTKSLRRVTRSSGKKQKKSTYNVNASFNQTNSNHQSDDLSDDDAEGGESVNGHQTK